MKIQGIRIHDEYPNGCLIDDLSLMLKEIPNGDEYQWSILYFYGTGYFPEGNDFISIQEEIVDMKNGYLLNWKTLCEYAKYIEHIYHIVLIGCKNPKLLRQYSIDEEMYESCDISIELFDSTYWEIFAKNTNILERYARKFKVTEWIESDHQNKSRE